MNMFDMTDTVKRLEEEIATKDEQIKKLEDQLTESGELVNQWVENHAKVHVKKVRLGEELAQATKDFSDMMERRKVIIDELETQLKQHECGIDRFWEALHWSYNIETREEIEKDCKDSWAEGASPLEVALHFIWKREPKVVKLVDALQWIVDYPCAHNGNMHGVAKQALAEHLPQPKKSEQKEGNNES